MTTNNFWSALTWHNQVKQIPLNPFWSPPCNDKSNEPKGLRQHCVPTEKWGPFLPAGLPLHRHPGLAVTWDMEAAVWAWKGLCTFVQVCGSYFPFLFKMMSHLWKAHFWMPRILLGHLWGHFNDPPIRWGNSTPGSLPFSTKHSKSS